jgi:hypothetical protein
MSNLSLAGHAPDPVRSFLLCAHLDQELVPPPVESLETLARVDVIYKHTTIRSSIERHSEGLESFLSGRVPKLHGDHPVVDNELSGEEVGPYS